MPFNIIRKERIVLEVTERKEIERKSFLGLFSWDTVINTAHIKDDLVIMIPQDTIENIWLYHPNAHKVRLVVEK